MIAKVPDVLAPVAAFPLKNGEFDDPFITLENMKGAPYVTLIPPATWVPALKEPIAVPPRRDRAFIVLA
jgi:hypothetical protein